MCVFEKERDLHSPRGCTNQGWARLKSGSGASPDLPGGAKAQTFGLSSSAFPGALSESYTENGATKTETGVHVDC